MDKKVIVIYASKYGTTKRYAGWIAQALNAELAEAKTVKPDRLMGYDVVIYGGGLYAGGIAGVRLVTQNPCKALIVFTVGLADPAITDYNAILEKNFSPGLLRSAQVFHLRGGIDYRRLGPIHKVMMSMMKGMIQKKAEQERDGEDRAFLETYGRAVDFTDRNAIAPIVALVESL